MPVVETNAEMKKNMQKINKEEAESKKIKKSGSKDEARTKEKINVKIKDVKEEASDKKDEIQEILEETKKETELKKNKSDKESEKQGVTPAEKVLNDIVTKFRQGSDQLNEAISDYSSESSNKVVTKPLVDVLETNDTIYLIADISGVKKDNIEISISKNSIELSVKYKKDPKIEGAKFIQKERSYGITHRKIVLPTEIKVKKAKAKFKNCTLTITLPKMVKNTTQLNIDD